MSLEAAIAALTKAVEANTAAIESGGGTSSGSGGKASPGSKGKSTGGGKAKAKTTVDVLAKRFGAYLSAGTAADKKTAKANVAKMNEHYEVDRISNVDEELYDEVLAMLDQFEAGEDPLEGEGGDDDSMI